MNKALRLSLNIGLAVAIVLSVLIPSVTALADNNVDVTAIGDVTDPGILPDSGFYFIKSWGRNLQLMVAASDTEKANLLLQYSNEDALGLKKLCDMGKCDIAAKHAEQYELQLQNAIQNMEQVRVRQGEDASEELVAKLEQNYLQQQEVLLSVLEKAPEAAQNGILNAIENSNKHVGVMILAHQGQAALEQYQEQVNQQTNNMGESTKIRVRQRLQITHGQVEQTPADSSGQGVMTQQTTQTQTQTQTQTSEQIMQQTTQQNGQQTMQNQGAGQSGTNTGGNTQGAGNKKQGK